MSGTREGQGDRTERDSGGQAKWGTNGGGEPPEHVREFVRWLCTPESDRPADQKTQADWARANGFTVAMPSVWKRDPRVRRLIEDRCRELNIEPDRVQQVINAMFRNATQGDVKAAALYLQFIDKLNPKRIIIEDRTLSQLSDEEMRDRLIAAGMLPADAED